MSDPAQSSSVLGIVSAMFAYGHAGGVYIHLSFGRVIDRLASQYERVYLCVPLMSGPPDESTDYRLAAGNIEVVPQPFYKSSIGAIKHVLGITRAYSRMCRLAPTLFVRGLCPYIALLYLIVWLRRRRVVHWIVSNPIKLLGTHRRSGRLKDTASLLYAWQDRLCTRLGRKLTDGTFVCNGQEVGEIFASRRTIVTVSSTVTAGEFHERSDTCQGSTAQILFVGFIRPEKGIRYLIEAAARLDDVHPWHLTLVGSYEKFPAHHRELEDLIVHLGISDRVTWAGYVSYGPRMFQHLRDADLFVLPTLSEGTPRVLVEARANSLPIIATNVGGIPTSVTDGVDGLLVPPKDTAALAKAIRRVIVDEELRRTLIRNGRNSARRMTLECFTDTIADALRLASAKGRP